MYLIEQMSIYTHILCFTSLWFFIQHAYHVTNIIVEFLYYYCSNDINYVFYVEFLYILMLLKKLSFLISFRILEHSFALSRGCEERGKRPNYRPILEHDGLLWHRAQNQVNCIFHPHSICYIIGLLEII